MKTQNIILGNTRQAGGKLRVENWQIRLSKILVAVMVSMVISCQKDINLESTPETETETEVILTIRVPGGAAKMEQTGEEFLSRAMTPVQENTISQVHVLLFSGGNLQSIREGNNIQNVDDNNRRFNARLNKGTFDLMIVANSGTQVATLTEGITLAEVETALRITQTTKWNDNNPIPLWGELNNAIIDVGAQLSIIKMSRALTKIDILVDAGAQDDFTLQTVSVYHWQQIGALIPNPRPTADYVTQPIVTGSGLVADTTVLKYLSNDLTAPGRALESSIYINETPNPGISAFPVMPCLIVEGIVDGEMRYYRIDYTETSSSGTTYRDLLRNWHYQIVIKNIITNGSPTEEEAYKSTEVSINAEIIPWEEGNMGNVIIDGTTWLRVDPGEFKLSREERTATRAEYHIDDNELVIKSNVDWSIDQSTIIYNPTNQTNWLNLSQWSGNANTKYDMKIYVAANTGTVQRTATFTVTAGTIRYQVVVTQTTEPMISLTVAGHNFSTSPTFHLDYKKYGEQRIVELDVEWYPADWDCKVSLALSGSYQPLEIMSGITDGEVLTGGKKHIILVMGPESANPPNQVGSNTPFRGNILNFTVGEGASAQTVPVYIYTTFHFMINNATPGPYQMDMRGHSLELLTNMFFRIKSVKDEDEILTPACKTRLEQFEADFSKTEPVSEVASWSLPLEFVEPNPSKDGKKPILKLNTIRHLTKLPTHSRWK